MGREQRTGPVGPGALRPDDSAPVYAISVAAQIAGMHPQTLRQYDRLGLVSPDRTSGRNRLYSLRDIARLREVARLTGEGVNLAGIQRILVLENENERLRSEVGLLRAEVQRLRPRLPARADDDPDGPSTALVVWRPRPADRDPRSR
ncbi:MAG: helix-turn-helix transcriptional regulator [Candidatus Nanopelagicales bacterium]|jgi:MerR family transcriptional regulator/heat shock protein HspR